MAQYANAVITKTRTMYGRMLSPAQYDELLRKQSVQEITAFLKEKTSYASVLAEVQESTVHRGQLENLLHRDVFYQFVRLVKYVREEDSIYQYLLLDMEIELILSCMRNIISGKDEDLIVDLPTFIQSYCSFNMFELAGAKTVDQIFEVVRNTPYGPVIARCNEQTIKEDNRIRYAAYEVALRIYYYSELLRRAKKGAHGKPLHDLCEIITMRAEMTNINTIFRLKEYFQAPPARIRRLILPFYCKLTPRQLDALIEAKDESAFMQLLSKTPYGRNLNGSNRFIETQMDNMRYRMDRRLLHFSTDPKVVYTAFMLLRDMEIENIIRIIEGVRYQIAPEKIEKLLYRA